MKTAVGAAAFFIWVNVLAAVAGEREVLRLPGELAKMTAEQVFRYETAALGYSVRYSDRKARMRGDVYVYPSPKPAVTAAEIKQALRESAGSALWEVEEMQRRVMDFVNAARRCVLDPGLRGQVAAQIETYRRDPLSKTGHDLAGGILSYAEATPLIALTIDEMISTLGEELEKEQPGTALELLRAFIVGAVAESLKKPGEVAADLPQAGAAEVVRVFGVMQKAKPGLSSGRLVELESAVKGKRMGAWLRGR